jgi:N-acetyl-gamma-glutamyl-phosphate reductase
MTNIGILGATGYTALELIKLLLPHPEARIVRMTSRSDAGLSIEECHPSLRNRLDQSLVEFSADDFFENVEFAFSCLPHAAASPVVKQLVDRGIKTVDFSADYRLNDIETYNQWYQSEHADQDRVGETPYGLPELFREQIKGATLVANPGCFPTSSILPLAPLIRDGLIESDDIVVDSKTGVSGGGRKPKPGLHFPESNESVMAYGIGTHRHGPEISQIVKRFCGVESQVVFTPHLIPMNRGILSTIYVKPKSGQGSDSIRDCLQKFYKNEPYVRITDSAPRTRDVSGTNFCDIGVFSSGNRVILVSAIDNLIKGASGAAVQNFNLMMGLGPTTGLLI